METLESVYARRAVKHYDPAHVMSEEEIKKLMSATMQSPTSFNMQNWRFVILTDRVLREKFKAAAWGQGQVTDASLLIILTADLHAPLNEPTRYWNQAPQQVSDMMVNLMVGFYKDKPELQRDEAMRSTGIAAQTIMLAAKSMGYDSCPMVGFDFAEVARLINLPENHVISMMITVGKAIKPVQPKGGQLAYEEVVKLNAF